MRLSWNGGKPSQFTPLVPITTCSDLGERKRGQKKSKARTGKDREEGKIGERHSQEANTVCGGVGYSSDTETSCLTLTAGGSWERTTTLLEER